MKEKTILNLKISYLEHLIKRLPRGWIGRYRGQEKVIITYDPQKPKVTYISKRRYGLNTKKGHYYCNGVEERIKAEANLKKLMAEWQMNYIGAPEVIEFPLRKIRFSWITKEQFMKAEPNQNPYEIEHPIPYKGQTLRSKNELLSVQAIESMGFMWKTEISIKCGKYSFYPDVVFYVPYIDKVISLELDGMMEKDDYYEHAEERRAKYIKAGLVENKDVIFFRLNNKYDFNMEDLISLIETAIERNAADILIGKDAESFSI